MVRFSASGIHQPNNYELKVDKRQSGPQAAQTKGVSITWTKWDESSNLLYRGVIQHLRFGTLFRISFVALIKSEHLRT